MDSLIRMATSTGSTEMNLADILNSIMDTSHTKDSESDSTFLTQLLERGVIQGVVRNECHTGSKSI